MMANLIVAAKARPIPQGAGTKEAGTVDHRSVPHVSVRPKAVPSWRPLLVFETNLI